MAPAQIIADRFELEQLVGSGGMGEVFRARDRLTGGAVAVKVLHASSRDTERFRREAQILAEVSHPRIVKYVAHGISEGSRPYIAMEWLDGEDLGERLSRSGLTLHETLALARRACEGLAVLHERGIVHRDIKPSNLFLPKNGTFDQLKLLDLGVARLLHASRPSTRSGVMVGTPGYMAPEQARGNKEIDARADVFSMGCVMYECLAGRPVFQGDNIAALLAKILLETPITLRDAGFDIPPALDDLITRMLSKHVTARPTNGSALLRELEPFKSVKDSPAQRASTPAMRALTGSERRLVSVVMAAVTPGDFGEEPAPASSFDTIAASFDPRTIVASFGGEAEMLADGSIVVTLSGKGAASDQAAHAARCALSLRSHLISAHVALATGLATVTGRSCVGEVIERAAAIMASARARRQGMTDETLHGETPVFLDDTTAGLLDMRFDVGGDDRGLFIRGLRERDAKARTLLGKPTPFVGRERELSTLIGTFEECIDEPVARAVLVTGQAGAGKSRMASEFLRRVGELGGVEAWLARGDPMSEGSPFSLLARLLRRAAGISGAEPLVVRQQKLRARIGRHVPEADVTRVSEFVGEIASVHFNDANSVQLRAARHDAMLMGDQMRRAFCELVLAEAASGP
ncbi:MAG: Adenylate cyclase, partial [Labilithrix sp.]|nr:Adenylate cyclase [Labilithrix sp.]